MDNITLGRYIPLDSLMHKFDPRAKIMAMFILMISIFMPSGFIGYIGIVFVICIGIYLSKLNLKFFWKSMKPMFFMLS
ncbi:MAG: energy-coupling factor transporter transmembrane protein EcfT, partial [Traorella sp.]